jgi:metal-responsive CopG/Arc/MetJ family transcriptional regulator
MKAIQMTIDEPLQDEVDHVIQDLKTTRSAFICSALQLALRQYAVSKLEKQHTEGYARYPLAPGSLTSGNRSWHGRNADSKGHALVHFQ